MKRILLMIFLLTVPLAILAEGMDGVLSTGDPVWYYFEYIVTYPGGGNNSGNMKVCASNAGVAVSAGKDILESNYGEVSVKLYYKGKGENCDRERFGEMY